MNFWEVLITVNGYLFTTIGALILISFLISKFLDFLLLEDFMKDAKGMLTRQEAKELLKEIQSCKNDEELMLLAKKWNCKINKK